MELLEAARRADYWDRGVRPNVDTFSTLSRALNYRDVDTKEYRNRLNVDREYARYANEPGLEDNTIDFIPGSTIMKQGSKLGRFDKEASAMARSIIKEPIDKYGRRARVQLQNELASTKVGKALGVKEADASKLATKTRWLDEAEVRKNPDTANSDGYFTSPYNEVTMIKNPNKKTHPGLSASDNLRQLEVAAHEGMSGKTGHAMDFNRGTLNANRKDKDFITPAMNMKSMGYGRDEFQRAIGAGMHQQSEFIGYNAGLEAIQKAYSKAKKSGDKPMIEAAELRIQKLAEDFAPFADNIPDNIPLKKIAMARKKEINDRFNKFKKEWPEETDAALGTMARMK